MANNNYIAQREADRQKFFVAGCELVTQQMFDMLCLALHDPDVMGRDTFGAERLKKVHKAMFEYEKLFHDAWMNTPESDYLQEKLDGMLKEIFGDIEPFNDRYPHQKTWNYNKAMKGGANK